MKPFAIAAAVVLALALGVWVMGRTPAADVVNSPVTTTTGISTTTTVPASTTTEGSTTTTNPTTTTTPTGAIPEGWYVTGVAANDVLNVRSGPGVEYDKVGELAHDASNVQVTRWGSSMPGQATWIGVGLADGTEGYVNGRFLQTPGQDGIADVACAADSYTVGSDGQVGVSATSGTSGSANLVLAIDEYSGADCTRYVITLGEGDVALQTSSALAGQVQVISGTTRVTVRLPEGITDVAEHATSAALSNGLALAVVPIDGDNLEVRFLHDSSRLAGVAVLTDPARVVVDVASAPTGTGLDYTPIIGEGTTLLEYAVDVTVDRFGVTSPAVVVGYARWFEAQGYAAVTYADGSPVPDVAWSGPSLNGPPSTEASTGLSAPWSPTWGEFRIELYLPAGSYKLLIGDDCYFDDGGDYKLCGVTQEFDIAP